MGPISDEVECFDMMGNAWTEPRVKETWKPPRFPKRDSGMGSMSDLDTSFYQDMGFGDR